MAGRAVGLFNNELAGTSMIAFVHRLPILKQGIARLVAVIL
jgi:hypothetical protein